jgi:hypothetical protein
MRKRSPPRAAGSIVRVNHLAGRWEAIPRALIEDANLTFLARWFAIWLASRPPGWEIRAGALPRLLKDHSRPFGHLGRDSTRRCLKELENAGYLVRKRHHDAGGHWVWRSCFNATKVDASTMPWNSVVGSSGHGNSGDISDTDSSSTLIKSIPTTTTETAGAKSTDLKPVVVVVPMMALEFPKILKGSFAASAQILIDRCPAPLRQPVLDAIRLWRRQETFGARWGCCFDSGHRGERDLPPLKSSMLITRSRPGSFA